MPSRKPTGRWRSLRIFPRRLRSNRQRCGRPTGSARPNPSWPSLPLNPRDPGIWINLAYIRRRTQSLDAAVDTLQRAFEANPKDALAHYNMACYRAMQHREGEAIDMLRNALCLDPKLKALAKAEPDFCELRLSAAFQQLLKER